MRIVHVSYVKVMEFSDPHAWLKHISFFTGIVSSMSKSHEVFSIHCINYEGEIAYEGVTYIFLRCNFVEKIFPLKVNNAVTKLTPDVLIIHGLPFPWEVLWLKFQLPRRVKIFIQHHAEKPLRFPKSFLQRVVDPAIKKYFFTSGELATPFIQMGQIESINKVVEVMEVSSPFYPVKEESSFSETTKNYLWVGRLDPNKDPITLVKGFIEFAKHQPGVVLNIIFRGNQLLGELKELLEQSPGACDYVHLTENVSHEELSVWYNRSGFIISTSHYEGSGTAVCEALSCGCVPVLSDIPAFVKISDGGNIGFLYNAGDPASLVKALQATVGMNYKIEREKVLTHFRDHLSFDAISEKILKHINAD